MFKGRVEYLQVQFSENVLRAHSIQLSTLLFLKGKAPLKKL